MQPTEALTIAAEAGRVLAQAHAAGRIHGNLRCVSIMLHDSTATRVTIQGFGGEGATAEDAEHLAPERVAGSPPTVATDIYSFGRILERIREATTFAPETNSQWDAIVLRCLDPIAERRFPSVESVLQAIGVEEETLSVAARTGTTVRGPKSWGPFQLLQRVGAGGFGEVYRAWDPVLEREVALKLLRPHRLDPEGDYSAIVAEARAIARVRHPNIVSVYGVDRHDRRVGFWSDFVRGQTLADMVATHGLCSAKDTAEMGISLCEALAAMHHASLLHRDIKASNSMRSEEGRILLMDFGLSQDMHRAGGIAGTPNHMAPELLAGNPPTVHTDIYAMGVLLLYLCTGGYSLPPASEKGSPGQAAVPPQLEPIIRCATHQDPQQRYASATRLRDALAGTLSSATPAASNAAHARHGYLWMGATAAVLLAIAITFPFLRRQARSVLAGTSPAAYQDFLAAEDALQRFDKPGNTEEAIKLYQQTLERSPDFALAQAGLARANWRMYLDTSDKKWASAADQAAARAATRNSEVSYVQTTLGTIHVAEGKDSLGTHELEHARELDPRSADAHAALGEAYRQQGRLADAKTELQTAMDLAPDDWRWPYWLGALEIDTGDYKSAEKNLKNAMEKTPDNARVLYDLGLVYRKQERLDDARTFYERALKLDSQYLPAMVALGTVLRLEGRFAEAVPVYQRAVEQRPGNWYLWGKLGDAEQWADHPDEMARSYKKAVELASEQMKITPDDPFLVTNIAAAYASLHDETHALPLMRKALRLAAQNPDTVASVAESYELLGNRDEALKLIAKALQLGYSAEYAKKTPELRSLRKDPRAPQQIR